MGAISSVSKENCVDCFGVGMLLPSASCLCIYLSESSPKCLLTYLLCALQAMNVWENVKNISLNSCPVITFP